jgi:hypothetical protein
VSFLKWVLFSSYDPIVGGDTTNWIKVRPEMLEGTVSWNSGEKSFEHFTGPMINCLGPG